SAAAPPPRGVSVHAAVQESTARSIRTVNRRGPFLGVVVPNIFEMKPLLGSASFSSSEKVLPLRFRFDIIGEQKVVIVMTGLGMYSIIAGNADRDRQIGDVAVPRYWAHTGLWNRQTTRGNSGSLNFTDYSVDKNGQSDAAANLLNGVWYQPEEVFPASGTPEVREHAFWVPVDGHYYDLSRKLEDLELEGCVVNNGTTTCLPRRPVVAMVERGCSASVFVDNAAYREFHSSRFGVTAIDMETAAVALVALQQGAPFIAVRALSDLAGGGSAQSNEAGVFASLAAQNAVAVAVEFISEVLLVRY
ncbi:hypothetical protein BS78_09G089000, partial [Paspalum vaginatum]